MSRDESGLVAHFHRQVENLLQKGYPSAAGLSVSSFLEHVEPLKDEALGLDGPGIDLEAGRLSFVIVIKSDLVPTGRAMSRVEREGRLGVVRLYPREPKDFETIEGVVVPAGMAYLLVDIDRGKETINMPPDEALRMIGSKDRSPLTIDEGVAIVTHFPGFLMKNNCFSLLASRHRGDRRVPAIWLTRSKEVNLGWCWAGNPHTWLGSASCGGRVGASR